MFNLPQDRRAQKTRRRGPVLFLAAITIAIVSTACEPESGELLWKASKGKATLYIQASIPFVQPEEKLKPKLEAAIADSKAFVFETDTDNFDDAELRNFVAGFGSLPAGKTLDAELGPEEFKALEDWARETGFKAEVFAAFRPWIVGLTVNASEMTKNGWNTAFGLDPLLAARAKTDGKDIEGIAPVEDEAKVLGQLPDNLQKSFLAYSLQQAKEMPKNAPGYLKLWEEGNSKALATAVSGTFKDRQDLYQAIVVERYKSWIPKIESLLDGAENRLLVLDLKFLVGSEGLIEALKTQGITVTRQ